jgi:lysophospholipase L1-like esterase
MLHLLRQAALAAAAAVAVAALPASAAAPITYVALGDSTAVGVGAGPRGGYPQQIARRLEAGGVPVKLVNLAVSGATVADLRRDQLPKAMSSRPTLVTICIGVNDLTQGRPLREFARDLHTVSDLVKRTRAAVVIATLPDLTLAPSARAAKPSFGRRIEQYNAAIQTVAERHGFLVADVHRASRDAVRASGAEEVYASDGFHPSAAGYEAWTDAMWPAVERALAPRVQARRAPASPRQE